MNIFKELKQDLRQTCKSLCSDDAIWQKANIEIPKDPLNGDISTNVAMILAAKEGKNPKELALEFKNLLSAIPYIAHIEIAGPGFINFTIKAEKWHFCIKSILNKNSEFWQCNIGGGKKVNVEYVSANPTGPMHIGHARGAVYGDVLANILAKCGYNVTKEYYVNDAGSQVQTLTQSAILRYKEALSGKPVEIPEGLYPGEYLKKVGQDLVAKYGDSLLAENELEMHKKVKTFVIEAMLVLIKDDLAKLGVKHDVFFSEESLHEQNKIQQAVDELRNMDMIYEGTLPPPKGKTDEDWQERSQLLFRSSKFGDDQDRPVQKGDNSWSYLAADLAYAKDKIDRGFVNLVYVLGADHSGYVKRIEAIINAFGRKEVKSNVCTNQLVNFVKNGEPIKMSKRKGSFMTVQDVVQDVDRDIIRFIMLTRRNDMVLDFDFDKVKEQSKDNPVFYVQYANVRLKSIVNNAKKNAPEAWEKFKHSEFDLSLLESEEEIRLIKLLASWPKVLIAAAEYYEPQRIAYYLIDVASHFHSLWNLGKENSDYLFVISDDSDVTASRIALVSAVSEVIHAGFEVIGITPLTKM